MADKKTTSKPERPKSRSSATGRNPNVTEARQEAMNQARFKKELNDQMTLAQLINKMGEQNVINKESLTQLKSLNKNLTSFVKKLDKMTMINKLNKAEEDKEKVKKKYIFKKMKPPKKNSKGNGLFGFGLIFSALGKLLNPKNLLKVLFGTSLAVGGSFLGLRGWEGKFMKGFYQRFFKNLGLDKDGKFPNGKMPKPTWSKKLFTFFAKMETNLLKMFGLDVGMKQNRKSGKFAKGFSMTRIPAFEKLSDLFDGLRRFTGNLDKMFLGKLGKVVEFFGKISGLGAVTKLMGKILFPLGVLFSLFDGIKTWQHSKEAKPIMRFLDGVSAFIGDFIGAPLDLLKKVVSWGLKKMGFEKIAKILDKFSFESVITRVFKWMFDKLDWAVSWITGAGDKKVDKAVKKDKTTSRATRRGGTSHQTNRIEGQQVPLPPIPVIDNPSAVHTKAYSLPPNGLKVKPSFWGTNMTGGISRANIPPRRSGLRKMTENVRTEEMKMRSASTAPVILNAPSNTSNVNSSQFNMTGMPSPSNLISIDN